MEHRSTMDRYGMMLMAASMAIALFVATQAIAAPVQDGRSVRLAVAR